MFLFRCVLHPLPLSSCLGCIPPPIGLPSLRFYAVGSSLFLLSVCFCLCFLFYRDDVLCWLLPCPSFSVSMLISDYSRFDLVWFHLSCDHGWNRSGSVNVRKQKTKNKPYYCVLRKKLTQSNLLSNQNGLGGNIGCKNKKSTWYSKDSPT